jgi:hypothetical protein
MNTKNNVVGERIWRVFPLDLSRLPNPPPHNICIFMCRYREILYYFILTVAWTLIILTILANFCLFSIISRPESCFNVHLHAPLQLNYSITPSHLECFIMVLRPLI